MNEYRFSAKQKRLLQELMTASSVREAAHAAGMSEPQAYRVTKAPAFVAEWNRLRNESLVLAKSLAQREAVNTVRALIGIRDNPAAPGNSRVGACVKLMELAEEQRVEDAAEQRIVRLESITEQLRRSDDGEQAALPAHWREDSIKENDHGRC